ncbi:hypothetical protein VHEMI05864 [[Torrubiella] hemipterigena]|uniref:Peptidase S1A alpha-lytic prodomain domain-containing protein n=1 Tax=[Torrubiella] hemipterigena TaxID=1531966 RepID=A0A0A1THQ0_9HYPO|nr:hypothetical protein VHEMI05864 [[Torrubiella] hemipterigena]
MELTKFLSFLAAVLPVAYGAPTQAVNELHPDILAAMQRDFGLNAEQATARVAQDIQASSLIEKLRGSAGPSFAGGWIDGGKAVIGVTDQAMADQITAQGGVPVVMKTPLAKLEAAKTAIDNIFLGGGAKRSANDAVAAFYVDEAANKVVFEALASGHGQAADLAKQAGLDASQYAIKTVSEMPTVRITIKGGDAYHINNQFVCSVGFSVNGGFVSAGHCGKKGADVETTSGAHLGTFAQSVFPGNADMSYIKTIAGTKLTGYINGYGHADYPVRGHQESAVGASVCRSGQTTGVHCGTIQRKNATVNYGADGSVTGLTQTNACADHGDSGGGWFSGTQAQGVTSGGSGNCKGGAATTYFQPVNEILSTYGLTLVTA